MIELVLRVQDVQQAKSSVSVVQLDAEIEQVHRSKKLFNYRNANSPRASGAANMLFNWELDVGLRSCRHRI